MLVDLRDRMGESLHVERDVVVNWHANLVSLDEQSIPDWAEALLQR